MSKSAIILCVCALAVLALLGRWQIIPVPGTQDATGSYTYRLDRWTGEIELLSGAFTKRMTKHQVDQQDKNRPMNAEEFLKSK